VLAPGTKSVTLFPGEHMLALGNPLLQLNPNMVTVESPGDTASRFMTAPHLNVGAREKFAAAAKSKLDSCLAEKTLETTCGLYVPNPGNVSLETRTITWALEDGSSTDFSKADFTWEAGSLESTAYVSVDVYLSVYGTDGAPYKIDMNINSVVIDFSDPDNLAVSFGWSWT